MISEAFCATVSQIDANGPNSEASFLHIDFRLSDEILQKNELDGLFRSFRTLCLSQWS